MIEAVHSKLGASSYYRWKACPGSVRMCEGIESTSSEYAQEGTLAHDLAGKILQGSGPPFKPSEEMATAVTVYLAHITKLRTQKPSFEAVEQRFDLSAYHPALFGTADYVCYFSRVKTLHVVDYKHGAGIPVEVEGNTQLLYYGLGALHKTKLPVEKIVLTIVQPRCEHPDGPVRSWEVDPVAMTEFSMDLVADAKATEDPWAAVVPGDHCRFCPAQPTCPTLRQQVLSAAFQDETNAVTNFVGNGLEPGRLAYYLSAIPRIKEWCESVHKYAHAQAELGIAIPGWKLVDKRATRKWAPEVTGHDIGALIGANGLDFYEQKLMSPAAIEKLLPKDQRFLLDQFVVKESSGKTLVPDTDKRLAARGKLEAAFVDET